MRQLRRLATRAIGSQRGVWQSKPIAAEGVPFGDAFAILVLIGAAFAAVTVGMIWLAFSPASAGVAEHGLEVKLGDFSFGTSGLARPRTLAFQAVAVVGGSPAEQSRREELLRIHAARVGEAVEEAGRAATKSELDEPDLTALRGRLRGGVNGALRAAVIDDVLIADFRVL